MDLEADAVFSAGVDDECSNPLTSSQESNLRRLSVVKEENEEVVVSGNAEGNAPEEAPGLATGLAPGTAPGTAPGMAPGQAPGTAPGQAPETAPGTAPGQEDECLSDSSSEEYSDASDSMDYSGIDGGTDLDHVMRSVSVVGSRPAHVSGSGETEAEEPDRRKTSLCSASVPAARHSKAHSCEDLRTVDAVPCTSIPGHLLPVLSGRRRSLEQLTSCRSSGVKRNEDVCITNLNSSKADQKSSSEEKRGCTRSDSQTPPISCGHGYLSETDISRHGDVSKGGVPPVPTSQTLVKSQLHYSSPALSAQHPITTHHSNPPSRSPTPSSRSPTPSTRSPTPPYATQQVSSDTSQASQLTYSKSLNLSETDL